MNSSVDNPLSGLGNSSPSVVFLSGCVRLFIQDAEDWRLWLVSHEELSGNNVHRRCGMAKQSFRAAHRKRLVSVNTFDCLTSSVRRNRDKFHFITRKEADKILNACPDAQWRLLFALSRYGGLRCPSEHLASTRDDIDGDAGRVVVHAPKTEHHPGKAVRVVPLFPELRPCLQEAFDLAKPGLPTCHHTLPGCQARLANAVDSHHQACWPEAVAQPASD